MGGRFAAESLKALRTLHFALQAAVEVFRRPGLVEIGESLVWQFQSQFWIEPRRLPVRPLQQRMGIMGAESIGKDFSPEVKEPRFFSRL